MDLRTNLRKVGAVAAIAAAGVLGGGCLYSDPYAGEESCGSKVDEYCNPGSVSLESAVSTASFRIKKTGDCNYGLVFSTPQNLPAEYDETHAIAVHSAPEAPIFLIEPEDPQTGVSPAYLCPAGGAVFIAPNEIIYGDAPIDKYPGQLLIKDIQASSGAKVSGFCIEQKGAFIGVCIK